MKKLNANFTFLFFLFFSYSFSQNQKDTIFLVKEKIDTDVHKVFIEPNKNSIIYKYISDFSKFPRTSKVSILSTLNIPERWVPIYKYKKKYYLYYPSDLCTNYLIQITQKQVSFNGCELSSFKINSRIKLIKENNYKLEYEDASIKKNIIFEIYYIDKKRGVAVFKYTRNNSISYQLMVNAAKIKQFPIIVNTCKQCKANEFSFDEINYKKLIKN